MRSNKRMKHREQNGGGGEKGRGGEAARRGAVRLKDSVFVYLYAQTNCEWKQTSSKSKFAFNSNGA